MRLQSCFDFPPKQLLSKRPIHNSVFEAAVPVSTLVRPGVRLVAETVAFWFARDTRKAILDLADLAGARRAGVISADIDATHTVSRPEELMAIRDLLIHIDQSGATDARANYALALAKAQGALPIGVVHAPAGAGRSSETARRALDHFALAGERLGLTVETRTIECRPGDLPREMTFHAHHTDLAVIGQPDADGHNGTQQTAIFEELLFQSGRPVLVVPWAGKSNPNPRIVIVAWDASGRAARALADALPILSDADKVIVLVATDNQHAGNRDAPGFDIARHLARHDIKVEARCVPLGADIHTADLLLSQAADLGAELMIMGGYHHSRVREFILGGVTRKIMKTMTLPVLMSH